MSSDTTWAGRKKQASSSEPEINHTHKSPPLVLKTTVEVIPGDAAQAVVGVMSMEVPVAATFAAESTAAPAAPVTVSVQSFAGVAPPSEVPRMTM